MNNSSEFPITLPPEAREIMDRNGRSMLRAYLDTVLATENHTPAAINKRIADDLLKAMPIQYGKLLRDTLECLSLNTIEIPDTQVVHWKEYRLDRDTRKGSINYPNQEPHEFKLSPIDTAIFAELIKAEGYVVTKDRFLDVLDKDDSYWANFKTRMFHIRNNIAVLTMQGEQIELIKGTGYILRSLLPSDKS